MPVCPATSTPLSGSFGSNGTSSGFVQKTADSGAATTVINVFDSPSVMEANVIFTSSAGDSVPFPEGTRYDVFPAAFDFASAP